MKKVLLVIIAISMCLTGCMSIGNNRYRHPSDVTEMSLRYLERKYNDKLEYESLYGGGFSGDKQILFKSEELNDVVLVRVDNYTEKNRTFSDNYLAVKYKQNTVDFLYDNIVEEFKSTEIEYEPAKIALSNKLKANSSFSDYISDDSCFISATIKLKASELISKDQVDKIVESITSECKADTLSILFVFMSNEDYDNTDIDSITDYAVEGKFMECARLTQSADRTIIEWLDKDLNVIGNIYNT